MQEKTKQDSTLTTSTQLLFRKSITKNLNKASDTKADPPSTAPKLSNKKEL